MRKRIERKKEVEKRKIERVGEKEKEIERAKERGEKEEKRVRNLDWFVDQYFIANDEK